MWHVYERREIPAVLWMGKLKERMKERNYVETLGLRGVY
jgi:hypothetical protein